MADMGYRLLQTVTSTLCEQCGPAIGEPQAASTTNSLLQFGSHMGGGTLHWQAAGNGGPLTVTFLPSSSSSSTPPPPVAPTPLSLPPIEDRSEAPSLPIPTSSPFPGPIIPGKGMGKAPPSAPNQSPELAPPANTTVPEEPGPQDGPPATSSMDISTVGYGKEALASSSQIHEAATFSCTDPSFNHVIFHRNYMLGFHLPKSLIPEKTNIGSIPSTSSPQANPARVSAIHLGPRTAPLLASPTLPPAPVGLASLPPIARGEG